MNSGFIKNIMVLIAGGGISQLIVIATSPILTRLYSPEQYGVSALFLSVSAILAVFCTGRYEMAIMQAKYQAQVRLLVCIAFALTVVIVVIFTLIFYLQLLLGLNLYPELNQIIHFVPFYVVALVVFNTLSVQFNWHKQYNTIASSQIVLAVLQSSARISFGYFGFKQFGLILGTLVAYVISSTGLGLKAYMSYFREYSGELSLKKLRYIAIKYKNFPRFVIISDGLNIVATQSPVLLTGYFFEGQSLGLISLAIGVCGVPITVFGTSLSRIFKKEASDKYNKFGRCDALIAKTMKHLFIFLVPPFAILFLISPYAFEFIFGEPWRGAGVIVRYLIPLMYMQFIARIVNYTFMLADKQKQMTYVQAALMALTFGSFAIADLLWDDFHMALLLYSLSVSVLYIVTISFSYKYSKGVNA